MQHAAVPATSVAATTADMSPSAWSKRLPILSIALFGLVAAIALATYQLGMVTSIWDPLFGNGSSEQVVTTSALHFLPIPDAVLGVVGYGAELLAEAGGGEQRWRTMPWLVLAFGAIISALALVSVSLILTQALVVHAWCSLCLASALISFTIFALGVHEPLASLRYLRQLHALGEPVGEALWGRRLDQRHA
jgi:uncharacterized membrane protein